MSSGTCKRIYLCPSTPKGFCQWQGDNTMDILEHIQNSHKDLLMDSNSIKADITENNEQNRIMVSENGLFLVQTKVCLVTGKLFIRLRFLQYNYGTSKNKKIKVSYTVEVTSGKFGFTNDSTSEEDFSPVYNSKDGVEVDFQTISLMNGVNKVEFVTLSINIKEGEEEESETDNSSSISEERENIGQDEANPVEYSEDSTTHDKSELKNVVEENREETETNITVDAVIKCMNCCQSMIPPIYICPDGHSVCYHCKEDPCKTCGLMITQLRNIDLEEYSKTLEYPCMYETEGCSETFKYNEIRKHQINCKFYPYKCEYCDYEGRVAMFKNHFKRYHSVETIYETMVNISFGRGSDFWIINDQGVFHCTSHAAAKFVEWNVMFCGPKERCFSCEVRIMDKKQSYSVKNYILRRDDNVFSFRVSFDELKSANAKDKYSRLFISTY